MTFSAQASTQSGSLSHSSSIFRAAKLGTVPSKTQGPLLQTQTHHHHAKPILIPEPLPQHSLQKSLNPI
ncbi:hypothetical protein V6Z11_D04G175500 [Gossypium hirsutum]